MKENQVRAWKKNDNPRSADEQHRARSSAEFIKIRTGPYEKKIKIAVLFGGKSAEHEVSANSMKNVVSALDKKKYDPILIRIDKSGRWFLKDHEEVAFLPGGGGELIYTHTKGNPEKVDVVFPILHGPFGEDGSVQGLLKIAVVPYVGAGILGSAVGMDKDVQKRLLQQAGIPVSSFLSFTRGEKINLANVIATIGLPLYVKPANLGSSVGISKVKNKLALAVALKEAFKFDNKIIIEKNVSGREIECAVLGNENPKASLPGEVICRDGFYSYGAKYKNENDVILHTPAKLPKHVIDNIQSLAVTVYKTLDCSGLGRVDLFLQNNGRLIVNEINTMPGFTSISMFPRLWQESGMTYPQLIDRLIELAFEKFANESKLKTSYQ